MTETKPPQAAPVPSPEAARALAMADFYNLAALLLEPPTPESVEAFARPELAHDLQAIALEAGAPAETAAKLAADATLMSAGLDAESDALGVVRREFTRLFSHPKKPVIERYEGVFVDDELVAQGKASTHSFLFVNPSAEQAERAYKEAGFVRTHKSSVPADCITTELQFMGQLHLAAARGLIEGDEEAAYAAQVRLDAFWAERIVRWVPRFFERCIEESRISLYALIGEAGLEIAALEGALRQSRDEDPAA